MAAPDNDPVNHPQHYTSSNAKCSNCDTGIECIDVTRHMTFNIGNALKYLWRHEHKNGIEDLEKAIWYIKDEIIRLKLNIKLPSTEGWILTQGNPKDIFNGLPTYSPGDIPGKTPPRNLRDTPIVGANL